MIATQFIPLGRMSNYDLHTHSNISDGLLPPAELVERAAAAGVSTLALTDHDDVAGLPQARETAERLGIDLVNGVEISVTWRKRTIHIVGLRIDPLHEPLVQGLSAIRQGRALRARRMADSLAQAGIAGALEGAYRYADNPEIIGRTHFARFLVHMGYAKDVRTVFRHYLVGGKPGYVPHEWAALADAVQWIVAAGGIAVLAHPGRYDLGRQLLPELIGEFKEAGGQAIEVVTGSHTPDQYNLFARYAQEFDLLASRGSDFHGPGESYVEPGALPPLPASVRPVWHDWG